MKKMTLKNIIRRLKRKEEPCPHPGPAKTKDVAEAEIVELKAVVAAGVRNMRAGGERVGKVVFSVITFIFSIAVLFFLTSILSSKEIVAFSGNFGTLKPVSILVSNPYSLTVKLEVKCSWNEEKNTYDYVRLFTIPGKSKILMKVPRTYEHCQIWPKIKFF